MLVLLSLTELVGWRYNSIYMFFAGFECSRSHDGAKEFPHNGSRQRTGRTLFMGEVAIGKVLRRVPNS